MSDTIAKRLLPVVIGILLTILLLFLLGYLANRRRQLDARAMPTLQIYEPDAHALLDSPLVIRFSSSEALRLKPSGWGYANLHLHVRVNGVEHMPAASEIQETDSGYVWTLPAAKPGLLTIKLGWADERHRELVHGAITVDSITLR